MSDIGLTPQLRRFVGGRTGTVSGLKHLPPSRTGPQTVSMHVDTCDLSVLLDRDDVSLEVGGKGRTVSDSLRSGVGEAVERYSLQWPREELLRVASYDELAAEETAVPFDYVDLHDDEQFDLSPQLSPVARDEPMTWCQCRNLLTGEVVYAPADLVLYEIPEEYPSHFINTTNGAAAGETLRSAVLNGLYEVIERDAVMHAWHTQTRPNAVLLEEFPEVRRQKREEFDNEHLTFHLFEFDSPIDVPIVGCAAVDSRETVPKFVLAGGAASTYEEALLDAMTEAAQSRPYARILCSKFRDSEADIDPEEIRNLTDNVIYYSLPENYDQVSFLFEGNERVPTERTRPDDEYDALLAELDAGGYTPLAVDLTPRDVRETGLRVVKVFVPELLPLSVPSVPFRNHPRVEDQTVTDKPHPYP